MIDYKKRIKKSYKEESNGIGKSHFFFISIKFTLNLKLIKAFF